ncbi:MAG: hypothetical protein Q8O67_15385 [Deltaproteobacteria bacterium]|nr:hypothetical protein [Deltaproteobacteria bacterium]
MDLAQRQSFLSGVAEGRTALRDVGGLGAADVDAIARVGAASLQAGRFEQAEQVFVALSALEPDVSVHALHIALARQGKGDVAGAIEALSQMLRSQTADDGSFVDDEDVARALLLRAELCGRTNREQALQDLTSARALTSPLARKVVDALLGPAPTTPTTTNGRRS